MAIMRIYAYNCMPQNVVTFRLYRKILNKMVDIVIDFFCQKKHGKTN